MQYGVQSVCECYSSTETTFNVLCTPHTANRATGILNLCGPCTWAYCCRISDDQTSNSTTSAISKVQSSPTSPIRSITTEGQDEVGFCALAQFQHLHNIRQGNMFNDVEQSSVRSSSSTSFFFSLSNNVATRCVFCLLGIGLLVPWNAFVSAAPYFVLRTCRNDAELWFGFVYNLSSVASLACRILGSTKRTTPSTSTSVTTTTYNDHPTTVYYYMVMIPLSIYLAIFLLTTTLIFIPISKTLFLIVTLMSLATCGAMGAIASAGLVATASSPSSSVSNVNNNNHHHYDNNIGPLFAGQAVGGVVVSAANFLSALGESPQWDVICPGEDEIQQNAVAEDGTVLISDSCVADEGVIDWAVVSYFGMSCGLLAACLVGFQWLYSSSRRRYQPLGDANDAVAPISSIDSSPRFATELALEVDVDTDDDDAPLRSSTLAVWTKIRQPALTIFLTFVVTLAIFPAWTSTLQSAHRCDSRNRLQNDLFTPLTFLWFNVFDLVGRLLAERYSSLLTKNQLIPYALSRCILFLLFAMLPSSSQSKTSITPIPSDMLSFAVQATLAASNGFLISWSFLVAPSCISKQNDNEPIISSEILNLSLSLGLLAGSMLSFVYLLVV